MLKNGNLLILVYVLSIESLLLSLRYCHMPHYRMYMTNDKHSNTLGKFQKVK